VTTSRLAAFSAAGKALLDLRGRGGQCACSGRKPKGAGGSPNRGLSTPRSPGSEERNAIMARSVPTAADARAEAAKAHHVGAVRCLSRGMRPPNLHGGANVWRDGYGECTGAIGRLR
jgi:hypothetical protein